MATSGSYDYSINASQLIVLAAEDIGILAAGETLSADDQDVMLRRLNLLVKQWQGTPDMAPGLKVWTRQRVTLFLAKGQQTYTIGPASTDSRATTQYGRTTLSAAEAAAQTVLSITSNTDTTTYPGTTVTMTSGDIVGIELDDGTIQWTTISGTPTTTMTVATALTGAAASGNYVWWFTSRAQRIVETEAIVLQNSSRQDTYLQVYRTVQDYEMSVDKQADGDPTAVLIEPIRLSTRLTLNSQPDDVTKVINITALYPQEDYDATTNDIAFPQEYYAALEWELALRCCPAFGRVWTGEMQANYERAVPTAMRLNPQNSSAFFQPGLEG